MKTRDLDLPKDQLITLLLSSLKGDVCKEFEKICQTEKSFKRMVKEMHDLFGNTESEIRKILANK